MASEEAADESHKLTTIWAITPPHVTGHAYARTLLGLITADPAALASRNPEQLFRSTFGASVFRDPQRSAQTTDLRRLFLYMQTNLYHIHMAFDYRRDGILSEAEWHTWKGLLRETHAHPVLLLVIWHGHENRYFSRNFAKFLQAELCAKPAPSNVANPADYDRNREFIRYYYPQMFKATWPDALPDY